MDFGLFVKIVADIKANGHKLWQLHIMGEPLLDRQCERRLRHLVEEGMWVNRSFSTNCMLLTPERAESLIDAGFCIVHAETNMVRLCIDSMIPEVYDKLRIGGNHELVIANALNFINRTRGQIKHLQVQRLLTEYNADEPMGPFQIFGVPIRTQKVGRHQDKSRDFRGVKDNSDLRSNCHLIRGNLMWIASDGRATSCCLDCDYLQPYGDLTVQTIDEIRLSERRARQKAQFAATDYSELAQCAKCYGNECTGHW